MTDGPAGASGAPGPIETAVFPVAGRADAFLPATKALPKELSPILDRPLIQFAVDEARAAGCTRFVFIVRPGDTHLQRYFSGDPELRAAVAERAGADVAARLDETVLPDGAATFVEQPTRRGLGEAVLRAREAVGDAPFALVLPDDLIDAEPPVLAQMTARLGAGGLGDRAMIAGIEVTRVQVSRYGVMRIDDTGGDVVAVQAVEEKPDADAVASNFAVTGRYLLPPRIFAELERRAAATRGPIELTDAIDALVGELTVQGVRYRGQRFDCGAPAGVVRATLAHALKRSDLRQETLGYLRRIIERASRG